MIFVVVAKKHTQKNILISIRLFLHLIFLSLKTKGQFLNHSNQNSMSKDCILESIFDFFANLTCSPFF